MGGNTSVEFRSEVLRLCNEDASRNDHERWKVFFLTHMQAHEVPMFFGAREIQYMRLYKPANLAAVLYKCMEQLRFVVRSYPELDQVPTPFGSSVRGGTVGFTENSSKTTPTAKPGRSPSKQDLLDWCCARNAIRMIGAILPVIFEPVDKDVKLAPTMEGEMRERLARQRGETIPVPQPSPFAERFADHFLWENLTCESAGGKGAPATFQSQEEPLGEELMKLLCRLCFIPGFTIGWKQRFNPTAGGNAKSAAEPLSEEANRKNCGVVPGLLWGGGILNEAGTSFATSRQTRSDRTELLRCITACCCRPVFGDNILTSNPLLDVLNDPEKCPLTPTLCCSLINIAIVHVSRGILPWTSYYFADDAEACLSAALQLVGVLLSENDEALQAKSGSLSALGSRPENDEIVAIEPQSPLVGVELHSTSTWCFFLNVLRYPLPASLLIQGLRKVIDNPCFSANTKISGSQKIVHCYHEALVVTARLCALPNFRKMLSERSTDMLYSLLFFAQEARSDYSFFGPTQAAVMILLSLSTEASFLLAMRSAIASPQTPLQLLPKLPKATFGDVLCLMICSVISPSSPRYMSCFHESLATILCNVAPHLLSLSELTCYELIHLLEFVTSPKFLRHGVQYQRTCALIAEGLSLVLSYQPAGCRPLFAALGIQTATKRLLALAKNETLSDEMERADPVVRTQLQGDTPNGKGKGKGNGKDATVLQVQGKNPPKYADPTAKLEPLTSSEAFRFDPSVTPLQYAQLLNHLAEQAATTVHSMPAGAAGLQEMATRLLPPALTRPDIAVRHYDLNQLTNVSWLQSYLWGVIYKHNVNPPMFDANKAKVFDLR